MTNEQYIRGIQQGNQEVAMAFYRAFGGRVSRLVWRLLGADTDHEDVVQTAFVNIISSIGTLRSPDALADWVVSVVYRTVRREIERRSVRRKVSSNTEATELAASTDSPHRATTASRFYEALEKLETEDRMLFTLKYVEEYELQDIATIADCSLATVKRRINRAKDAFEKVAEKDPLLSSFLGEVSHVIG